MFDTAVLGECATYPYGYILAAGDKYIKELYSHVFHQLGYFLVIRKFTKNFHEV